jgi:hypothetical protein
MEHAPRLSCREVLTDLVGSEPVSSEGRGTDEFLTVGGGRRYHHFAMSGIHSEPEERGMRSARKKRLVGAAAGAMEDRKYQRIKK